MMRRLRLHDDTQYMIMTTTMMTNTGTGFRDKECKLKVNVLHLAGKEVGDKDRTGRDSLRTLLALVVVVVLPAATSVLCKYIVDSDRLQFDVSIILAGRCTGSQR